MLAISRLHLQRRPRGGRESRAHRAVAIINAAKDFLVSTMHAPRLPRLVVRGEDGDALLMDCIIHVSCAIYR